MRILLDEFLPKKLGFLLESHFVRTVQQMGFSGLGNGKLLAAAAPDFDILITGDQNMEYQQNQFEIPMSVMVLVVANNKLESFLPLIPMLLKALEDIKPKSFVQVKLP
jgi:predicted nuclease of predicted toxin-antitoxin system